MATASDALNALQARIDEIEGAHGTAREIMVSTVARRMGISSNRAGRLLRAGNAVPGRKPQKYTTELELARAKQYRIDKAIELSDARYGDTSEQRRQLIDALDRATPYQVSQLIEAARNSGLISE